MASEALPKVDASPLLLHALAFSARGYEKLMQVLDKSKASDKISAAKEKVEEKLASKRDIVLVVVGFVLVFYGAQFKNLLLCTQVVRAFLYDRISSAGASIFQDVKTASEKLKADAPAEAAPKESNDEQSKHAKKRDAKKAAAASSAASGQGLKEDAENAKKVLKVLDQEKVSNAVTEILASLMACLMVIHGGLAQKVAIAVALVNVVIDKVTPMLIFPGFEPLEGWIRVLVRLALSAVALPLAIFVTPLALALDAASFGAKLALTHGCRAAEAMGKLEKADEFVASEKGYMGFGAVTAVGTLWQLWSWSAGSGMAWYVQLPLLPAIILESLVGLL